MRCSYACNSAEHKLERRRFLGTAAAGIGAYSGLGVMARPAISHELASQQKRVICIFLAGGSSQLETWDPKPKTDTGGPFLAIPTSVPGIHISELLPKTALQMHHLSLIRSINTNENDHGLGRYMMETGRKKMGATEFPHLGAVTAKALDRESPLPGNIHVSSGAGSRRSDSSYLGPKYASIVVGAKGGLRNSTRMNGLTVTAEDHRQWFRRRANSRFLERRRTAETDAYAQSFEQALQLMEKRDIFDVSKEPQSLVEKYGDHELGKQCLLGRRLLESGISYVQVSHSNYDTHNENFNFHLEQMGEFDQSFSALISDLSERGMLESTLVVVMSEFGRTPRINRYYGRDHWGKSWSIAMAGCGIQAGAVIGKTNKNGTEVTDRQVDHRHLFHTYLHAVGVDSSDEFHVGGRSMPIADPSAGPITELLA